MKEMQTSTYSFLFDKYLPDDKDTAKELAEMKHSFLQAEMGYKFNTARIHDTFKDNIYTRIYFDDKNKILGSLHFYLPTSSYSAYIVVETLYQNGLNEDRKKKQRRK